VGEGNMTSLTKLLCTLILVLLLSTIVTAYEIPEPTDYGNGVLYFQKYTPGGSNPFGNGYIDTFGESLSYYLSQHQNQTIITIVSDNGGGYGSTSGFYVYVKTIEPKPHLICTHQAQTMGVDDCYNYELVWE
jgi:hypothetical protein